MNLVSTPFIFEEVSELSRQFSGIVVIRFLQGLGRGMQFCGRRDRALCYFNILLDDR